MSKNKFWNKEEPKKELVNEATDFEVSSLEDLEKTMAAETIGEIPTTLNFKTVEVEPVKEATLQDAFDILYNYPKNMFDDTYSIDTKLVADWLKIILKRKGYNL